MLSSGFVAGSVVRIVGLSCLSGSVQSSLLKRSQCTPINRTENEAEKIKYYQISASIAPNKYAQNAGKTHYFLESALFSRNLGEIVLTQRRRKR
jgi:hypothetical protein